LGYGTYASKLDADVIRHFLERVESHAKALESYERRDNSLLFGCVDELVARRARGKKRPNVLDAPALGKWAD
jgi:hypothetical protein